METKEQGKPIIFEELLQAQKARNDFMKWKLIIISAVGSTGLGFIKPDGSSNLYLIIILIPLICLYVDLLCRNLSIRSMKINVFASNFSNNEESSFDIQYHRFYQDMRKGMGSSLESIALIWSTLIINFIVTFIGLIVPSDNWIKTLFVVSGILTLILSLGVQKIYDTQKKEVLKFKKY